MRRALIPFWGLVKRELIRDLRRPRPMLLLAGVLVVAALVVSSNYPSAVASPMQMSLQSMTIFGGLSMTLLCAALVLLPGYAATSIVVERESDTFDLLALTLTRPTAIVLGKLVSSLGYFVLIVLAMLPFISTTMFLVGIDTRFVALAAVYLAIIALTCCSSGIMASALVRNTPRAVTLSYMCAFIALGGYMIPFGLMFALIEIFEIVALRPIAETVIVFLLSLSPLGAFQYVAVSVTGGVSSGYLAVNAALGQAFFSALALLVARRMIVRKHEERSFTSIATLPGSLLESRPAFRDNRALPPWPPVRDGRNPLLAREVLQVRLTQRMTPLRFLLIVVAVVPVMLIIGYTTSEPTVRVRQQDSHIVVYTWMIGLSILMAFVAPGSAAASWSREYERDTMDLLRMTLLTPRQYVWGKVLAALRACVYPLLLAAFASLPLIQYPFMSALAAAYFAAGIVTIAVTTFECVSIATFTGLLSRRTTACVLYGMVGSMGAMCAPFLVNAAITIATFFHPDNWMLRPWWNLSPITAYGFQFQQEGVVRGADTSGAIVWALCMIAQTGFSFLVTGASVRLLARRHLQDR
ncbi:MAG: ABC transporter permease [Candidatus Hydrogenedentes bacterium]|nr:ABC transporter permease [Candidatus Hydrogenedentota bacterium]